MRLGVMTADPTQAIDYFNNVCGLGLPAWTGSGVESAWTRHDDLLSITSNSLPKHDGIGLRLMLMFGLNIFI